MTRSSPGVRRVAAILNFMAEHPGESFALTDLVRALKLSRATCHALLTGLVEVGYLFRTSDKTYVLGPALAAIGRTAADHFSPLQVAKPEMRALADAFDVVCGAYFLEADEMHLRDRASSASHVAYPVPLGTRMKLRSAQAVVYYGWSQSEAEAWLGRATPRPSPDSCQLMFEAMKFARTNGFAVLVRKPGVVLGEDVDPVQLVSTESDDLPVIPIAEIAAGRAYPIGALMAPVFDARGKVGFSLVLAGFHGAMNDAQIMAAGARLAEACARISDFVAGNDRAAA